MDILTGSFHGTERQEGKAVLPLTDVLMIRCFLPLSAYSSTVKTEAVLASETSVNFFQTTRRHIPEGSKACGSLSPDNKPRAQLKSPSNGQRSWPIFQEVQGSNLGPEQSGSSLHWWECLSPLQPSSHCTLYRATFWKERWRRHEREIQPSDFPVYSKEEKLFS
jgi:hypothetical protein